VMFNDVFREKRVLLTGHTGFKGAWLAHWLLKLGAKVRGVALEPATNPALFPVLGLERRLEHRVVDIRDMEALAVQVREFRPDLVLHLAAQPLVRRSYREPKETWDTNVGGTVNLLEVLRTEPGVRACVVVTSDKCYENREQIVGYRETDAMGGYDPYSASKGAVEIIVSSYRRSYFSSPNGMYLASARAGNVIGGGDWSADRIVTDFVSNILKGQPLVLRYPWATRPWQHVLEPLSGYLTLASHLLGSDADHFAEGWNFGPVDESVWTVERLARGLVKARGAGEVRIERIQEPLHETGMLKLDCSKAAFRMGWHGVWNVETTIRHTVDWYRAHEQGAVDMVALTNQQLDSYIQDARVQGLPWTQNKE